MAMIVLYLAPASPRLVLSMVRSTSTGMEELQDCRQRFLAIYSHRRRWRWSNPSVDYATRVANLIAGNGVPALTPTMINVDFGNQPGTVHSNGGGNTLLGGDAL